MNAKLLNPSKTPTKWADLLKEGMTTYEVLATEDVDNPVAAVWVYAITADSVKNALWGSSSKGPTLIAKMEDAHLANTIRYAEKVYHERVTQIMEEMEEGLQPNTPENHDRLSLIMAVGPEWFYPRVYRHLVHEGRFRALSLPECYWFNTLCVKMKDHA